MQNDVKALVVYSAIAGALAIALGCTSFLASLDKTAQTVCLVATGVFIMSTLYLGCTAWHRSKVVGIEEGDRVAEFALKCFVMIALIVFGAKILPNSTLSPYAKMALGAGVAVPFLFILGVWCPPRRKFPSNDVPLRHPLENLSATDRQRLDDGVARSLS